VQAIAKDVMTPKAWAYYSSAADDEITNRENHLAYARLGVLYSLMSL
jgi:L-lactate dehydrogenase (cytochrome)